MWARWGMGVCIGKVAASATTNYHDPMTTVQITLPDDLARDAAKAGLLASEAMQVSLRRELRARAKATLDEIWQRPGNSELTDADEAEIAELVRKARKEGKAA